MKPTCQRCGEPIPAAADGLCPRCLLRSGLAGWPSPEAPKEFAPGYRLLEKIGEGGMGEVFLAEQLVPVRREVAVKRLKAGLDTIEWVRRFDLEREALAQLEHPNIAAIYGAGLGHDARPYYAMELVDGLPLTHFCDRGKLDVPQRLRLLATICAAVQHAHQKGVLHGDLKPSNILVAVDEAGAPVPKIIDFGFARAMWHQRGQENATSYRFGTPGYASPEQGEGARPPDARSDVYSLGVILDELISMTRAPRSADVPIRSSLPSPGSLDLPKTPSAQSPLRSGKYPASQRELGWIVTRATAPVPEQRYESTAALAADLGSFLASRPLAAGPATWTYRARKFIRRERHRLAWTLLGVLILAFSSSMYAWQSWRARQAELAAETLRVASALHVLRAQITDRMTLGAAAQSTGDYERAEQHLLAARQMAAELGPGGEMRRREVERALAHLYLTGRHYRRAEAVLKELMALPPLPTPGPEEWEPLMDLVRLYIETRRFDDAEAPARRALEVAQKRFHRKHPVFLKALYHVGRVHTEQRRYREAHEAFTQVVAGFRSHYGPEAPDTRQAIADLAEVEHVLRKMELLPANP